MTLYQACHKAATRLCPANATDDPDPYAIPEERAEGARRMVGAVLRSRDPGNHHVIQILRWIGQNYVLCIDGKDYDATPVMWLLQEQRRFIITQ